MADIPRITPGKPIWPHHSGEEPPPRRQPGEGDSGEQEMDTGEPVDSGTGAGDGHNDDDGHIDVFV